MNEAIPILYEAARRKALDALTLVEASLSDYQPYSRGHEYSPKEREPYDALADRYMRAIEVCIKYFRSYERMMFADSSETYRDLLQRAHKRGMIASPSLWFDMRDLHNRIVHDYLPDRLEELYTLISGPYGAALMALKTRLVNADAHTLGLAKP